MARLLCVRSPHTTLGSSWIHLEPYFLIGSNILALSPRRIKAVGAFHLAIAPWVSHRGIVYVDAIVLAEVPEFGSGEGGAQVCDDPIGHSELVRYLRDELTALAAVVVATGFTSIHMVNLSMATII